MVELEDLAVLLASREFGADIGETQNAVVDNLIKLLITQPVSNLSLKERVSEIVE